MGYKSRGIFMRIYYVDRYGGGACSFRNKELFTKFETYHQKQNYANKEQNTPKNGG